MTTRPTAPVVVGAVCASLAYKLYFVLCENPAGPSLRDMILRNIAQRHPLPPI